MTIHINYPKQLITDNLTEKGLNFAKEIENDEDLGFTELTDTHEYIAISEKIVNSLPIEIDTLLVLGIGGSALGTSMVLNALPDKINKKVIVLDNVDSSTIDKVAKEINIEKTAINVVSKSGGTVEPVSLFKFFFKIFENKLGFEKAVKHCILTTDSKKGVLRLLANKFNFKTLPIPSNVGGRFSILTPVSLFPLAFAGIDIKQIVEGAKNFKKENLKQAVSGAITDYLMWKQQKTIKVLFPYSDKLVTFGHWYLQLFAESLGKKYNKEGKEVRTGQTAVIAKGVTDQHSQLQLYMEGPANKYIAFFSVKENKKVIIPDTFNNIEGFKLTSNKTFNQLMNAEMEGTMQALKEEGIPVLRYRLEKIDEKTLGELIYLFEMQTAITGYFLNINPFNQPGVEAGKIIAKKILRQ
jgi:glucose-6-phosphate isomerase